MLVVLAVARETRLVVGQWVTRRLMWGGMQTFAASLPPAGRYCTDGGPLYPWLLWPGAGVHVVGRGKDETCTIEGVNADLRTYLGRLLRRSRCFSRSLDKLTEAVRLWVWHHNERQRLLNAQPHLRGELPLLLWPLQERRIPQARLARSCGHHGDRI